MVLGVANGDVEVHVSVRDGNVAALWAEPVDVQLLSLRQAGFLDRRPDSGAGVRLDAGHLLLDEVRVAVEDQPHVREAEHLLSEQAARVDTANHIRMLRTVPAGIDQAGDVVHGTHESGGVPHSRPPGAQLNASALHRGQVGDQGGLEGWEEALGLAWVLAEQAEAHDEAHGREVQLDAGRRGRGVDLQEELAQADEASLVGLARDTQPGVQLAETALGEVCGHRRSLERLHQGLVHRLSVVEDHEAAGLWRRSVPCCQQVHLPSPQASAAGLGLPLHRMQGLTERETVDTPGVDCLRRQVSEAVLDDTIHLCGRVSPSELTTLVGLLGLGVPVHAVAQGLRALGLRSLGRHEEHKGGV